MMALLLLLLSCLFAALFFAMHTWQRQMIGRQAHAQAEAVAHTMVSSLKTLMLLGEAESVHDWLARMRAHPELQSVEVLRRSGVVAFRDLETMHQVNRFLGSELFSRAPLPAKRVQGVAASDLKRAAGGTQVVLRDDAANRLTILEPIKVEQACLRCHGYEHNPVRGVLLVTTSTAAAQAAMWRTDRNLLGLLLMGLVLVALLIVLMHRYMEAIIRALGGMLFVTDGDGVIRMANRQAHRGLRGRPLIGTPIAALQAAGHGDLDFAQARSHGETVLENGDGAPVPVSVLSARMPWGSWLERAELVHVLHDLSQQKESEREIRLAATVMDTVPSAIMVADHDANIRLINPAFTAITGYSAEEALGRNPNILKSGKQSKEFYAEMWRSIREEGRWSGEIWNRRKNGEIYPEWLIINTMRDDDGEVSYYVSTFLDITDQKKMEDQLRHNASHDALTGLPNRVLLYDRLDHSLSRARRNGFVVGVLFVDIDGFKPVNDTHGHDAGDALLQQIAVRLRGCGRDSDTVARVGGDEFVMVVESNTERDVLAIAEKVLATMQRPFTLDAITCHIGASIGVSLFTGGEELESVTLLKQADTAMYEAKNGGKNRVVRFRPGMEAE